MPSVVVLKSVTFGRCLGQERGAFIYKMSAFMKEAPESLPALSTTWGHRNQEEVPRSWDNQPPELWEINFCCLKATQSTVFCYSSPNGLR